MRASRKPRQPVFLAGVMVEVYRAVRAYQVRVGDCNKQDINRIKEVSMPSGLKSTPPRLLIGVLTAILLTLIAAPTSNAQIPDLIITVGDTIGDPGEKNSVITVFLDIKNPLP